MNRRDSESKLDACFTHLNQIGQWKSKQMLASWTFLMSNWLELAAKSNQLYRTASTSDRYFHFTFELLQQELAHITQLFGQWVSSTILVKLKLLNNWMKVMLIIYWLHLVLNAPDNFMVFDDLKLKFNSNSVHKKTITLGNILFKSRPNKVSWNSTNQHIGQTKKQLKARLREHEGSCKGDLTDVQPNASND